MWKKKKEVLQWHDAERRRPAMYLGDTCAVGLLFALRGLMQVPREPSRISVGAGATVFRLAAECVPVSVTPRVAGRLPYFLEICTLTPAPLDDPPSVGGAEALCDVEGERGFVSLGMPPWELPILNAVSTSFEIASRTGTLETFARS